MATRDSKDAYTNKQKRKAEHIGTGYQERGVPGDEARARAWATVNAQDGGDKKSGSGRRKAGTAGTRDDGSSNR